MNIKKDKKLVIPYSEITKKDLALVGGKNASLGEMINNLSLKGIAIPNGFATTSFAYFAFLEENNLIPKLREIFKTLDIDDINNLQRAGKAARKLITEAEFSKEFKDEIVREYRLMEKEYGKNPEVAVRSSATAEDLPSASFAGLHETYLNIKGEKNLIEAVKKCIVSLFGDRVISYRESKGFDHFEVALSVGVQKMIRSDIGSSGIMFTMDTESGFENVVLINSIWGVGEMIVQGKITPDEFYVFKPALKEGYKSIILKNLGKKNKKYTLKTGGLKEVVVPPKDQIIFSISEEDVLTLARWGVIIEEHYGIPQDIEWAKDGKTGKLYIVQSRPETVHSSKKGRYYEEYEIKSKEAPLLEGIAVGDKIGHGKVRVIKDVSNIHEFKKGEVLVTRMTDPDWVSIMRMASAIVTDEGGKSCHAAIIGRELGIPSIVGSGSATSILKTGDEVTVDCTQGLRGRIFKGNVPYNTKRYDLDKIPKLKTKIMLNVGTPEIAFKNSFLPNDGVGLARQEFIIADKIKVHPLALYHFEELKKKASKSKEMAKLVKEISEITIEHKDKKEHFVKELAEGIGQIASAFYPKEVIVRLSDFKTNEYRNLVGGELYENDESNPMLGFRGACRYIDKGFQPAFKMECEAIKRARDVFGLKNITIMVPFCRTVEEGKAVIELINKFGLNVGKKGKDRINIYMMCEIPSNVILADKFLDIFDGMSIGSNDLTQLVLGLDRDNGKIAYISDERDESVIQMLQQVIRIARKRKKYCGICGQGPSDFLDFAQFLFDEKISSISLNPDTVIKTMMKLSDQG
ncbi:MAG: phosphoenolpyruvate synthase [Candidatus Nealsonbacteria bacterium]|nr:phosphoenolpyruvate synthase [Candidatus Nealsonbacteria bacterium]